MNAFNDELSSSQLTSGAPKDETVIGAVSRSGAEEPIPVPMPLLTKLIHSLAFAFSALLSPYLVIPAGTVGIVATVSSTRSDFYTWTTLSILFSTAIPAAYVVIQILRGKITDVHVMEREQRGGPFGVALASSLVGAIVLRIIDAPAMVWGIGVVLFFNGLVMLWITKYWKISIHVSVLSATIVTALWMVHSIPWWHLAWMIPALIWARVVRGRHTLQQGLAAVVVACTMTLSILYTIRVLQTLALGK